MKPDYKNWVPKSLITGLFTCLIICVIILISAWKMLHEGTFKTIFLIIFLIGSLFLTVFSIWMYSLHNAFSYDGKRRMSKQIIEGLAEYVKIPDGGKGLDVGCGSGALIIACAKKNPTAAMVGIDRWGKEYASFSKTLCENNATKEGVHNVSFYKGDATKLDFADETFDAVTSNYVYHNIPSADRQMILLETLRVLKKGGVFALHDIFSKSKYGDMKVFVDKLKRMGYEDVQLIDTTCGKFMTKSEAGWMLLSGSAILYGKK